MRAILAAVVALASTAAFAQTPPADPCASPEWKQFDFWVGVWDVFAPSGKQAGTNRIEKLYGCGIHESWKSGSVEGQSFNAWDPDRGVWHQTWVDNSGSLLLLEGVFRDGVMTLSDRNVPGKKDTRQINEVAWTPNADGTVRQLWRVSTDGGSTWSTSFDGKYVRMPSTRIFEEARKAAGGDAWTGISSIAAEGAIESHGMRGSWHQAMDRSSDRMSSRDDFGIVRSDEAWSGTTHVRQANRGGVHALDSEFGRQCATTELWLAQRRYLEPDGAKAKISAQQIRTEGDAAFLVVTATPQDGQPVELWFDAKTHLLARTVRRMNIDTETKRYSEYRDVEGVKLPFRIVESTDSDPPNTRLVTSYRLNGVTQADLAFPAPRKDWALAGGSTTVPIAFEGYVILKAKINGKGPFDFIVDTGGHDILTPAAAQALGLKPEGAGSSGGSGEGKVSEQYVRVDRLQIGGMTMRDQVFTVLPMPYGSVEQDPRPPLAGIIGLELFERFAVRIDYRGKLLTLTPLDTYHHAGAGVAIPLFFNDDEPLVKASLNGREGDFGIDTGNTGSLIVQGRWAEREGLAADLKKGLDTAGFGMGGESHNWASRADFRIAGFPVPRIIARYSNDNAGAFASIVEAGNVGNDILANFTVVFDYKRGQLWLESVPGFEMPPFSRGGISVSKTRPDAFEVAVVVPGGPASAGGILAGDTITAVDGVPAARVSFDVLRRKFRQAPGTRVVFDIDRKGQPISAAIELRELLP